MFEGEELYAYPPEIVSKGLRQSSRLYFIIKNLHNETIEALGVLSAIVTRFYWVLTTP